MYCSYGCLVAGTYKKDCTCKLCKGKLHATWRGFAHAKGKYLESTYHFAPQTGANQASANYDSETSDEDSLSRIVSVL